MNKKTRVCSIKDCGRPHRARGWCAAHWTRWRNIGSPRANAPLGARRLGIHPCDTKFFDVIDTEEKAYWLGFITSDGCITRDGQGRPKGLSIYLMAEDRDHLVKLRKALKATYKIRQRTQRGYTDYGLVLHRQELIAQLGELGIHPRKSFTVRPCAQVPCRLVRHYLRGLFDGDGGLCRHHHRITACFTGNETMVRYFHAIVKEMTGLDGRIKQVTARGSFVVQYNRAWECSRLCKFLYRKSNIYLNRKLRTAHESMQCSSNPPTGRPIHCSIENCHQLNQSGGFCSTHYARWAAGDRGARLHRPILKQDPSFRTKQCIIPGCEKYRCQHFGLCAGHMTRWRKGLRGQELRKPIRKWMRWEQKSA